MVKPKIRRSKRHQRGTLRKSICPRCHRKRVLKFHQCKK